jgi:transcriptional regulator with XRE-family HTH domain
MHDKNSRLEEIRSILALNKLQFAQKMGMSKHSYYQILNPDANSNVRVEHLEYLYQSTGANPMYIITGRGEKFIKETKQEWIVSNILPDLPYDFKADVELVAWMTKHIIQHLGVPIFPNDFAYGLIVTTCKLYLYRNPASTRDTINIPGLSASIAAMMQTATWLLDQALLVQERVTLRINEQEYVFARNEQAKGED